MVQDSYSVVNLYLGLQNETIEIGLYGGNVFDEGYHGFGVPGLAGPTMYTGDPRTYGIIGRVKF